MAGRKLDPEIGEVSIEAVEGAVKAAMGTGASLSSVLAKTVLADLPEADWPRRLSWDDYCEIMARAESAAGGPDAFEDAGARFLEVPKLGALVRVLGLVSSVGSLYQFSSSFGTKRLFANVETRYFQVGSVRSRFILTIPAPYRFSEPYIRFTAGALRALPRILRLPDSVVQYTMIADRTCAYEIEHAPSKSLWARFHRLFAWLRSADSVFSDMRSQNEELLRRLSELSMALSAAKSAQKAAEEADRLKAEFLRNVTHELRTPLNGISGSVQLLGSGTAEQAAIFADLNQSLSRFEIIFGELVDFSELEAKSSRVVCVSTSIPRLVSSLVARFENPAKERGMQIEADCSGLGQEVFLLDPFHTRSILGELIRNAIKHAAGCIRIRAVTTGGRLRFEVEDQGPGVGSNAQTHLFASVGQGDGTLTRQRGGIGLGLARCRRRVELLGGSMGFEPRGEQPGSRFWFEIPCTAATEAELAAEPMISANRVALVVEDDPVSARIISRMIERSGWKVLNAENGQRSLELLATEDVGIVFMDCQMPVMDGLTATRAIRESPARVSRLPVYAVTAHGLPAERAACLDAGMNDVLDKPVQRAVIEAVLKAHSVA